MKNLKQHFPCEAGWLHATLSLVKGHGLTVDELKQIFTDVGAAEFGHVEISGNKAKVIYREAKRAPAAIPTTLTNHGAVIPL